MNRRAFILYFSYLINYFAHVFNDEHSLFNEKQTVQFKLASRHDDTLSDLSFSDREDTCQLQDTFVNIFEY